MVSTVQLLLLIDEKYTFTFSIEQHLNELISKQTVRLSGRCENLRTSSGGPFSSVQKQLGVGLLRQNYRQDCSPKW
jgi:hypothetical protein